MNVCPPFYMISSTTKNRKMTSPMQNGIEAMSCNQAQDWLPSLTTSVIKNMPKSPATIESDKNSNVYTGAFVPGFSASATGAPAPPQPYSRL
jgi:hypothetical protein